MKSLVTLAVLWSWTCYPVQIDYFGTDGWPADIQFSGSTTEGYANQDGLTLYPWQTDYTAFASAEGSVTTVGFYVHGPEWSGAFSFNNITGEVLSDVWTIQFDWDRIEDVAHSYAFGYDLETGSGRIQWSEIYAAEPLETFGLLAPAPIPDAPWSPALLGIGITGLLITHAKNRNHRNHRAGNSLGLSHHD